MERLAVVVPRLAETEMPQAVPNPDLTVFIQVSAAIAVHVHKLRSEACPILIAHGDFPVGGVAHQSHGSLGGVPSLGVIGIRHLPQRNRGLVVVANERNLAQYRLADLGQ